MLGACCCLHVVLGACYAGCMLCWVHVVMGACCWVHVVLGQCCCVCICLHVELKDMGSAGKMSCSATAMALNIAGLACAANSHWLAGVFPTCTCVVVFTEDPSS